MARRHIEAILCTLVIMLIVGCEDAPRSERWIGIYSYPNNSIEFPVYLELTVRGDGAARLLQRGTARTLAAPHTRRAVTP